MFEAKLEKGVALKKILDAIKELVNEASWECTSSGMSLQAMDTSHVSLIVVNLNNDGFVKFRCDRNMVLGMNLVNLSKILKCAGNDDKVTIKAADGEDKIKLIFEAPKENEVSQYEIKLMNLDAEYLGIPETNYNVTIKMPAARFQRICRDLSQVGDSVTITCSKKDVAFETKGDLLNGEIILNQNTSFDKPEEAVTISMQEALSQTFALKYLVQFTKATPLCSQVTLSLSREVPLVVEYQVNQELEDSTSSFGHVRFYLAPKIDDNE